MLCEIQLNFERAKKRMIISSVGSIWGNSQSQPLQFVLRIGIKISGRQASSM